MLTPDELAARRELAAGDALLQSLAGVVRARVERVLREPPPLPARKALLSRAGGTCPHDGASLLFDPWQPTAHRCPRCNRVLTGERHDGHWARAGHLWVAERIADLAALAALEGDERAAGRARELLGATAAIYGELPNRDNVLGPTHLFFSTYLESLWITSWMAGAFILRQAEMLDEETAAAVDAVAEESATIIGEFNEGMSNRQVWNAAALTAIGAWFGDDELAQNAVESPTGLLGHLTDGFQGDEAAWWEGENYHLFAARGLTIGMAWARTAGFDLLEDAELLGHYRQAMLAPSLTALPDLTYPARKDSRFGVTLAQPAYLETWECARARLPEDPALDAWLAALYATPPRPAEPYDAWLHDAGRPLPAAWSRSGLSWWALLTMDPRELPAPVPLALPSLWLGSQGLAILRREGQYVSLECGAAGGGHGHPDRLHLTVHAGGVHWLPDPGTGSYVDPSLFYYRSARAHNAPAVDGESPEGARCTAFDAAGEWGWIRGTAGPVTRTVVAGPDLVVDQVDLEAGTSVRLELPWHLEGEAVVTRSEAGSWVVESEREGRKVRLHLFGGVELVREEGPGLPGAGSGQTHAYYVHTITRSTACLGAVLDLAPDEGPVHWTPNAAAIVRGSGRIDVTVSPTRAGITHAGGKVTLAGVREARLPPAPLIAERPAWDARALAPHAWSEPALDGTLEGFDLDHPLTLEDEHQYRRSEEPYDPERFAATAWLCWDGQGLYLAAAVRKAELVFRDADDPPLALDNEADDIHQDGLQLYVRWPGGDTAGFVVVPDSSGAVRSRPVGPETGTSVEGTWAPTDDGYVVTLALRDARLPSLRPGDRLGFDLVVNEMTSDRIRRLGQLVWSGDGGWTYLRGDRGSAAGVVELG